MKEYRISMKKGKEGIRKEIKQTLRKKGSSTERRKEQRDSWK